MSTITVEHIVIALFANGSGCRGIMARSAAELVKRLLLQALSLTQTTIYVLADWGTVLTL